MKLKIKIRKAINNKFDRGLYEYYKLEFKNNP